MTATPVGKRRAPGASGFAGRALVPCHWQVGINGETCSLASEVYWSVEVRDTERNRRRGLTYTKVRQPLCEVHAGCRRDYADSNVRSWTEPIDVKYAGAVL